MIVESDHYRITRDWWELVKDSYEIYMGELMEALDGDFDYPTVSNVPFCGCDVCFTREQMTFLFNAFAKGYTEMQCQVKGEVEKWYASGAETEGSTTTRRSGCTTTAKSGENKSSSLLRRTKSAPDATARTSYSNPIEFIFETEPGEDLLFAGPTTTCVCGGQMFHALVWFDSETREVGGRILEMKCAECFALVKGPTPVDKEEQA